MNLISNEIIVTLLVFLFGVQVLVLQTAPNDVRHVVTRHRWYFYFSTGSLAFIGLFVVLLYHFLLNVTPNDFHAAASVSTLVALLFLAGLSSIVILPYAKKEMVIARLTHRAIRSVNQKVRPDKEYLEDIDVLGSESKPGEERNWALDSLNQVSAAVLNHPNYSGSQLDELIEIVRNIMLDSPLNSAPENFDKAISLLREVMEKFSERRGKGVHCSDSDLSLACNVLVLLGKEAVKFPVGGVASACIGALTNSSDQPNPAFSQGLREIGSAAIECGNIMTAMDAFHVLDSMVFASDDIPGEGEVIYDYLGLLGYLWAHGASGRQKVDECLEDLDHRPDVDLPALIDLAVEHHRKVSRFAVADRIRQMWKERQER